MLQGFSTIQRKVGTI